MGALKIQRATSAYRRSKAKNMFLSRKQRQQVKAIVRSDKEKKAIDQTFTHAWSTNTVISHLTPIAKGDDENTRDGLEVRLRRMQLKMVLSSDGTAGTVGGLFVRVVIFSWNSTTAPVQADILNTYIAPIEDTFYDKSRGYIYYDKVLYVDNDTKRVATVDLNIDLKNHLCQYSGSLSTNISKGQLYMLCYSNTADADKTADMGSRVWYCEY